MGMYIAAVITTLLAGAVLGYAIIKLAEPEDRRALLIAMMITLPLQPLSFYLVRLPANTFLTGVLESGPVLNGLRLLYAPVFEEPAKWVALLIPFIRRRVGPSNALAFALAIGLAFGIGEIWFIARNYARLPGVAATPFWQFGPFVGERFMVCFLHGAFIAWAYQWLGEGKSFLLGGLIGMALHFAVNFPIFLTAIDWLGLGRSFWEPFTQGWIVFMTVALLWAVSRLGSGRLRAAVLGQAT